MFVLRSKVSIVDQLRRRRNHRPVRPASRTALHAAGLPVPAGPLSTALSPGGPRHPPRHSRFEIVVQQRCGAPALWRQLQSHARPVGHRGLAMAGHPGRHPADHRAHREEFVPQMANFEQLGGSASTRAAIPARKSSPARSTWARSSATSIAPTRPARWRPARRSIRRPTRTIRAAWSPTPRPAPAGGYDALAIVQENFVAAGDLELGHSGRPAHRPSSRVDG
jgi:hypothetical protein